MYEPVAIKPMKQISESREQKLISSPNAAGEIEFRTADTQGRRKVEDLPQKDVSPNSSNLHEKTPSGADKGVLQVEGGSDEKSKDGE